MRLVLMWKAFTRQGEGQNRGLGVSASRGYRVTSGKPDAVDKWKDAHASVISPQPCRFGMH